MLAIHTIGGKFLSKIFSVLFGLAIILGWNVPFGSAAVGTVTDYTMGDQNVLVVGLQSATRPIVGSAQDIQNNLFSLSNPYSLSSYYSRSSNGLIQVHGQVVGPINAPVGFAETQGCPQVASGNLSAIPAILPVSIDLSQFKHLIIFVPCATTTGRFVGQLVVTVNGVTHALNTSFVSMHFNTGSDSFGPIIHEFGHGLNYNHDHLETCGVEGHANLESCTYGEYESLFSIMGGGGSSGGNTTNTVSIYDAFKSGWISLTQQLRNPSPGSYDIYSRSASQGKKQVILDIGDRNLFGAKNLESPVSAHVSAEFQPSRIYSAGMPATFLGLANSSPGMSFAIASDKGGTNFVEGTDNTVMLRELSADWYQKGMVEIFKSRSPSLFGVQNDMESALYGQGTGYYDFTNRTGINVTQVFSDHATVQVVQDPAGCVRATPLYSLTSTSPLVTSGGRDNITLTYQVTNRDSASCGAGDFILETYQASPYQLSYEAFLGQANPPLSGYRTVNDFVASSPATTTIVPGGLQNMTVTVSAPTGQWRYGTAEFRLKNASVYGIARTWEASLNVLQPLAGCLQRQPAVSFNQSSYTQQTFTPFTAMVTVQNLDSGNCPVSIIDVSFPTVRLNSGYVQAPTTNISLGAGQSGMVTASYQLTTIPGGIANAALYARASKRPLGTLPYGPSSYPYVSVATVPYSFNFALPPPTVSISTPANNVTLPESGTLTIGGTATPASGWWIDSFRLYINDALFTVTVPSFAYTPGSVQRTFSLPFPVTAYALHSGSNSVRVEALSKINSVPGGYTGAWPQATGSATIVVIKGTLCPADYNHDGVLTPQDIFDFLNNWFVGSMTADFDNNGVLEVPDIFEYLNTWLASSGC